MYSRPRIIPTLLISGGNLVKTKRFKNPDYLGDPINAIKIFNEKSVDELCILDIEASQKGKLPDVELLKSMASEAFMPLSYGGGITNIMQMKEIFSIGFEKVILNTTLVHKPEIVKEAVAYFGSQSIIASIDYRTKFGKEKCYTVDAMQKTKFSPLELAKKAEKLGVGEILLYSIERDGMKIGYDIKTISKVVSNVKIPVIACGGAGNIEDIKKVLDATGVHAAAAGSVFVYFGNRNAVLINFPDEETLIQKGIYKEL